MLTSEFNRRWATLLIEALSRHAIQHVCIAPGSRSTPLTLAAAAHPRLQCHTHFDERGLGHLALGLAKGSGQPVAVIVTSGTAAANLYPALIEAGLTGERLVMLTADRPPELLACGANQAIRQEGMFGAHPAAVLNLPRPTPAIPAAWLVSALDQAMAELKGGALHINCPFAEPLYGGEDGAHQAWSAALGDWWAGRDPWLALPGESPAAAEADWPQWRQRRGVVLAGRLSAEEGVAVARWATALSWPLLADVQSQTGQPLPCAALWLSAPEARATLAEAELVVQFGSSLTGQPLLHWQANTRPLQWWLIEAQPGRRDPAHHRGRRIAAPVSAWLAQHPPLARQPWAPVLAACAAQAQQRVTREVKTFGEAMLAHRLPALLPAHGQLFLGNSLIVRLVDALAQLPAGYPVFGNRGASGIDGLISTAAGVQRATGKPTLLLLGDLSALYDLNALALLRATPAPLVILLVNNNGGRIFSLLPTPEAQREQFYCMPQQVSFKPAAAMFGLHYACPAEWPALEEAVHAAWARPGSTLIEVCTVPDAGAHLLQQLQRAEAS
ncbi:2-succinyl-5-enolpyruvyl-6-hydroxy-3-cyclohexene-1-carboxylic-acid synthase [Chimaeribacter coloradensis]|uniref:2-succinyl-5-enolpyruvyl-6-hydroxy-3-cyclohexene-1-carboxylate synthase n=1 Tax=Chimaeribacter coloradensis TaxID=2060068 RepID=A0A2N5E204_9GAMM|nr:2-succinyl-5-enolpyruvyl-6-hydroxy-3-cyclohexene-1-carboxylic-acid synthase [Chimaeribacter coloradensis]PLR34469.1 2-succinyl-5-enolpyruvyl-6-hydroxy-3-cyclohexene-1-carboxylic-acid synthase [Chimaeribacter coloradensis]